MKRVVRAFAISLAILLFVAGMVYADEPPEATTDNEQVDGSSDFSPPGTIASELGPAFEELFDELFAELEEMDPELFDAAELEELFSFEQPQSLIRNGNFNEWSGGAPAGWTVWTSGSEGWEVSHPSQVDLAQSSEGVSNALGWFIRNVGGSGSYSAGAYQTLDQIPAPGYYFVSLSEAIWDSGEIPYNSIAWYAVSAEADPANVPAADWRELDPYEMQCAPGGSCNYAGRDETLWIEPGYTFHIRVMEKFPQFNAWAFFIVDDITVIAADPESFNAGDPNGFYEWLDWSDDLWLTEDEKCHYDVEFCVPYVPVDVTIPAYEIR